MMTRMQESHLPELVQIGERLAEDLESEGIIFRLFGSCAVWWLCEHGRSILKRNERWPKDVDAVIFAGTADKLMIALKRNGWASDEGLRVWSEGQRLRFQNTKARALLDVCVGDLRFAQTLHIGDRITLLPVCLPPADLLLSKLQIVKMTRNDVIDIAVLMSSLEWGTDEIGTISIDRIAEVTRHSWRWHMAVDVGLKQVVLAVRKGVVRLSTTELDVIYAKSRMIMDKISAVPKTPSWRLRSLLGKLMRWYDEVDPPQTEAAAWVKTGPET